MSPKARWRLCVSPKKILERKINNTRILALLLIQEAEILISLQRFDKAANDLKRAVEVLEAIDDHEEDPRQKIASLLACLPK